MRIIAPLLLLAVTVTPLRYFGSSYYGSGYMNSPYFNRGGSAPPDDDIGSKRVLLRTTEP